MTVFFWTATGISVGAVTNGGSGGGFWGVAATSGPFVRALSLESFGLYLTPSDLPLKLWVVFDAGALLGVGLCQIVLWSPSPTMSRTAADYFALAVVTVALLSALRNLLKDVLPAMTQFFQALWGWRNLPAPAANAVNGNI